MRRTQRPTTNSGPPYAGLILWACSLIVGSNSPITLGSNWTITSSDKQATISTTDGATIIATGPGASAVPDDGTNGPGAEFAVQFSTATLDKPLNRFDCKSQTCTIDYRAVGNCP